MTNLRPACVVTFVAALTLSVGLAPAHAAPITSTSITRTSGELALASWSLDDQFKTFLTVAGNNGTSVDPAAPPFGFHGILLTVFQRFCDTSTNELVVRELSTFFVVESSAVSVNGALTRGSVDGDVQVSGVAQRTPNCASPGFSNRTFSFPTITAVDRAAEPVLRMTQDGRRSA